ncbi:acyltransferase [Nocardioides sp. BGMRC 2183]|nr:acyltransferase [Nocardioides sp. BGMRC 2183]
MTNRPPELRRLTGLRFVAAALVVVHHGAAVVAPVPLVTPIASLGYVGVTFFFVLSGFVLTWSSDDTLARRHFYGRRFARVYPTHLATLAIVVLLLMVNQRPIGLATTAVNVPLLHAWFPDPAYTENLNTVSWSLSDEAFFYAAFPFLLLALSRLTPGQVWRRVGVVLLATVVAIPLLRLAAGAEVAGNILYKAPGLRIGDFLVGVALALMVKRGWRPRTTLGTAGVVATLAYLVAVAGLWLLDRPEAMRVAPDLLLLGPLALLIVCAACADLDDGARTGLASPRVVMLGKASFQLYMTHFLLLMVVAGALPAAARTSWWVSGTVLLAFTVVAVGVSIVTFTMFEVPSERWLRRRLGGPAPARR